MSMVPFLRLLRPLDHDTLRAKPLTPSELEPVWGKGEGDMQVRALRYVTIVSVD